VERTTIICHFAHVWTHAQVKGSNLLVLLALADAADGDGSVRTTRQHIADRARVNRSTVHSAMAALFASGELMRYNAEAPDVVICVIRTGKEADKSAPCDNTESEFANDDTGDTLEAMSDFATQDEPRQSSHRTEEKSMPSARRCIANSAILTRMSPTRPQPSPIASAHPPSSPSRCSRSRRLRCLGA
jgi:hypothetical protein